MATLLTLDSMPAMLIACGVLMLAAISWEAYR